MNENQALIRELNLNTRVMLELKDALVALKKEIKETNQRVKVLQDGPALGKFLDRLNEV